MPLGGPGLAAGHFPDKYSFSNTVATCGDYVIYPTGAAGTATQATIVAFNNIYVGSTGNACAASAPTVYWAFNTAPLRRLPTNFGHSKYLAHLFLYDGVQSRLRLSKRSAAQATS